MKLLVYQVSIRYHVFKVGYLHIYRVLFTAIKVQSAQFFFFFYTVVVDISVAVRELCSGEPFQRAALCSCSAQRPD